MVITTTATTTRGTETNDIIITTRNPYILNVMSLVKLVAIDTDIEPPTQSTVSTPKDDTERTMNVAARLLRSRIAAVINLSTRTNAIVVEPDIVRGKMMLGQTARTKEVTTATTIGTTIDLMSRTLLNNVRMSGRFLTRVAGTVKPRLLMPFVNSTKASGVAVAAAMEVKTKLRRKPPSTEVAAAAAMDVKPRLVIPFINSTKTSGVAAAAATDAGTRSSQGPVPSRLVRLHPSA